MSEKRFIVIDKAGDSWVRDTQTGLEYWDFFHSVEDANSFADTFNAAKYPDLVLKLRGSVLDAVIDDTLSEFAAPLEQRIAELENFVLDFSMLHLGGLELRGMTNLTGALQRKAKSLVRSD